MSTSSACARPRPWPALTVRLAALAACASIPLISLYGSAPWRSVAAPSAGHLALKACALGVLCWAVLSFAWSTAGHFEPQLGARARRLIGLTLSLWAVTLFLTPLSLLVDAGAGALGFLGFLLWARLLQVGLLFRTGPADL